MSNERTSHSFPLPEVDSAAEDCATRARRACFLLRGAGPTCLASQRASWFFGGFAFFDRGHAARTLPPRRWCFFFFACSAATGLTVRSAAWTGVARASV